MSSKTRKSLVGFWLFTEMSVPRRVDSEIFGFSPHLQSLGNDIGDAAAKVIIIYPRVWRVNIDGGPGT